MSVDSSGFDGESAHIACAAPMWLIGITVCPARRVVILKTGKGRQYHQVTIPLRAVLFQGQSAPPNGQTQLSESDICDKFIRPAMEKADGMIWTRSS